MIIRLAEENDYDSYYLIKSDSNNILWGGFTSSPNYESFKRIFLNRINDAKRREYVCEIQRKIVGYLASSEDADAVEISYGVLSECTGKGIASAMIKQVCKDYNDWTIIAWVSEDNVGSERCLMKNGFVKLQEIDTRMLPLEGREHKFYKWERKKSV